MKKIISTNLYGVKCVIGQSTSKPNTITMRVDRNAIKEAVDLFDLLREDEQPKSGLIGLELVAVYADEPEVDINELKQNKLDLDIVENDLFDKSRCLKCDRNPEDGQCPLGCVTNTENVEDPDLFEEIVESIKDESQEMFVGCEHCNKNPLEDGAICSLNCLYNSLSGGDDSPSLFEPIPKSQAL